MDRLALPLHEAESIPDLLLRCRPRDIRRAFAEPTLIRLGDQPGPPLFVSCLLHGNETSGFNVLQRIARWSRRFHLPRPLLILVGNVHACEAGVRHLDHQPDYNRIWAGGPREEHDLAQRILAQVRAAAPFAAIDIHNNTGTNPLYGCINRLEPEFLHLASLFSPTLVHFDNPPSVISIALSSICPSVTIEAGHPGDPLGIERAFNLVMDTLHEGPLEGRPPTRPVRIFETIGRVELRGEARFAFSDTSDAPLAFPAQMDHWNFSERPAGSTWARLTPDAEMPLVVMDEDRRDISDRFFRRVENRIELVRNVYPSMITLDRRIIRSDCLCYFMEEMDMADTARPPVS